MFRATTIFFGLAQCCWAFLKTGEDQAWGANFGWIDFGADRPSGVQIGEFFLEGNAYSQTTGWISFGDGNPESGSYYSNTDGQDFGVNRIADGSLRGWAYSPNLGWIAFHENGEPRIDLLSGRFSGHAYALQAGWIALDQVAAEQIVPGHDHNGNGIPDSWEQQRLGDLVNESHRDSDGDGWTNFEEYQADTDPLDATDRFGITRFENVNYSEMILEWSSQASRIYFVEGSDDLIEWRTILGPFPGAENRTRQPIVIGTGEPRFYRLRTLLPTQIDF